MSKKKEKPGEIQGVFIQMKARTMCICDKHVEKENDAVILYDKAQVMHMECYTAMVKVLVPVFVTANILPLISDSSPVDGLKPTIPSIKTKSPSLRP